MSAEPVELHYADSGQVLATCGQLIVRVVVSAATELVDLDRVDTLIRELSATSKVGVLIVVGHDAPLPATSTMRHLGDMITRNASRASVAFVMDGLGFWASTAARTISLLAKISGKELRADLEVDAAAWRLAVEIPSLDAMEIVTAYETARAKLGVEVPWVPRAGVSAGLATD